MASADDKPKPFDQVLKQEETFVEGFTLPGETLAERRTRRFLYRLMRRFPHGLRSKTKPDIADHCRERFGIAAYNFNGVWERVIVWTGAIAYRKPGPRGPHKIIR